MFDIIIIISSYNNNKQICEGQLQVATRQSSDSLAARGGMQTVGTGCGQCAVGLGSIVAGRPIEIVRFFSQSVLHNWSHKGQGVYCPVYKYI